jgi:hypothetical protein
MPRKDKGESPRKKPAKRRRKASSPAAAKPAVPTASSSAPATPAARAAAAETPKPKPPAHYFDDPLRVKRVIQALFAVCGVAFLFDFVVHRHVDHPWEGMVGFYAIYGFIACVLLVLIAKEMRKMLMRKESYYDE